MAPRSQGCSGSDLGGIYSIMLRIKSHLALISLLLLSAKSPARLACSLASALTTARSRYQLFAGFTRVQLCSPETHNIFFIVHRQNKAAIPPRGGDVRKRSKRRFSLTATPSFAVLELCFGLLL